MPAVRVEVGYLSSAGDRAQLIEPLFRDTVAEAIVAAIQRMYQPIDVEVSVDELPEPTEAPPGRVDSGGGVDPTLVPA
jgi:hypothetical protein